MFYPCPFCNSQVVLRDVADASIMRRYQARCSNAACAWVMDYWGDSLDGLEQAVNRRDSDPLISLRGRPKIVMPANPALTIVCPPMYVRHEGPGLALTDELKDCKGEFTARDGSKVPFLITFETTLVRQQSLTRYLVDPTTAKGTIASGGTVVSELPAEPSVLTIFPAPPHMVAKQISAPTTLTLPDGSIGKCNVIYPDARTDWRGLGLWQVEEVTAWATDITWN